MTAKFTPGPWSRDKYGNVNDANGCPVLFRSISIAASGPRIAEAEKNTTLIAASYDLLVAAQDALGIMKLMNWDNDPVTESLIAAIAKATGK